MVEPLINVIGGCKLGWWLKIVWSEILVVLEDVSYTGGTGLV